ncbi:MAG: sensor histidine kinase [Planctomycetes bacterium]|nr:sensor histidine kinase [Planctomycetota bacterium]
MDHPLFLFCPFPNIRSDGKLFKGTLIEQSDYCLKKCEEKVCKDYIPEEKNGKFNFYTCPRGYSVATCRHEQIIIRINGVIEVASNTSEPKFKKQNKHRKIKLPELQRWFAAFLEMVPEFEDVIEQKAQDAVHAMHDIKSLIGSVLHTAENAISEQPGQSLSEKIDNSSVHLQTIYHSCEILQSLLQIADILTNPAVAQFGKPLPISTYGIILKLIKIHKTRANARGRQITLRGESHNSVDVYNSFIIIPHILIDNAIKHSYPDSEIRIRIKDTTDGGVSVNFSSHGNLVPEDERDKIFNRGVRGSNIRAEGSGLGLYIAQHVAKANGFEIEYKSRETGILKENTGYNQFVLRIPKSAPIKEVRN